MSAGRCISLAACALMALGAARAGADGPAVTVAPNAKVNTRAPGQLVQDFKSPSVAVNPSDQKNVVVAFRQDSPDYYCYASYSQDGGKTWQASQLPAPPAGTCWAPAVAFGEGDDVYLATQDRPAGGGNRGGLVYASTDGGKTFAAPVRVTEGTAAGYQLGIAVDRSSAHPGRVYATWYNFPQTSSTDVYVAFSDDKGATWSKPLSARSTQGALGGAQYFPTPAVGPDGTLYIVYKDTRNCPTGNLRPTPGVRVTCPVAVLRSSDGGQSFDGLFEVAPAYYNDLSSAEAPGIAIAPNGDILVTFASLPPDLLSSCPQDLDAFVARSSDRAQTWTRPQRINDDPCADGASQRDPWVSVAPSGRVDAIFYDSRRDPDRGDDTDIYDAYYASSFDGGRSFGPNVRASERSFDLTVMLTPKASGFQVHEFDQHNGIASTDEGAIAAWGDTRNATARSSLSDIFSTRIGLGSTGQAPFGDQAPPGALAPALGGCRGSAQAVVATSGDDRITGTLGVDEIFAAGGDDVVDALAGNDCVDLGTGQDRGQGGAGADRLVGGPGNDRVSGSSGGDRLLGGAGDDRLVAGAGNDGVLGGIGRDQIIGGSGNDRVDGGSSDDVLRGNSGNDRIAGRAGNDKISGASGRDRLFGGAGRDRILGRGGSDRIAAGSGSDRVFAGGGNDQIGARDGGRDRISCGRGRDTVVADLSDLVSRDCERALRIR